MRLYPSGVESRQRYVIPLFLNRVGKLQLYQLFMIVLLTYNLIGTPFTSGVIASNVLSSYCASEISTSAGESTVGENSGHFCL